MPSKRLCCVCGLRPRRNWGRCPTCEVGLSPILLAKLRAMTPKERQAEYAKTEDHKWPVHQQSCTRKNCRQCKLVLEAGPHDNSEPLPKRKSFVYEGDEDALSLVDGHSPRRPA